VLLVFVVILSSGCQSENYTLSSESDQKFYDEGERTNDPAYCKDIESTSLQTDCFILIAKEKKDVSICHMIIRGDRDLCLQDFGMATRDQFVCGEIQDQSKRDKCFSSVSANTNDVGICKRIESQEMKDGCIVEIVRGNPLEYGESTCERMQTQEPKDKCYKFLSWSMEPGSDTSLCEKIQNTEDKDTCYQEAGIRDNDVTSCERIETSGYERDYCFTNVGIGTSDPSLCERAENIDPRQRCYLGVAKNLGDNQYCNKIVNQDEKDGCNY
jgi:hypothetical protein